MKYSKYFGLIFKSQGIPKISVELIQRLMNIVLLEGELKGMKALQDPANKSRQYSMKIFNKEKQLTTLTGNLNLEDLVKEMFRLSHL